MTDDLDVLRQRYTEVPIPPCRICGAPLTIASMGGGRTVWCCGSEDARRSIYLFPVGNRHYNKSEYIQTHYGDADVVAIVDEVEAYRAAYWCAWCGHHNHGRRSAIGLMSGAPGPCMHSSGGPSPEPCGCDGEPVPPLVAWCSRCLAEIRKGESTASTGQDEHGNPTLVCASCADQIDREAAAKNQPADTSPHGLWMRSAGDREEYIRLMVAHGHLIPGAPDPDKDIFGHPRR